MTKKYCVVLDGKVINIGEWDYRFNEQEEAQNPLPEGAIIEEREFEYSEDYGWREAGYVTPLSEIDKLKISQAEQFETILLLLGGM